jgi:hypothetical protein
MADQPRFSISVKGRTGLIVAVAIVVVLLIMSPKGYGIFFAISVGIAVVVAAGLYFWHKYRPIRPEDVDNRPLKLD